MKMFKIARIVNFWFERKQVFLILVTANLDGYFEAKFWSQLVLNTVTLKNYNGRLKSEDRNKNSQSE